MKFLFIVQGDGRGHLTQALALEEILIKNGHEVVEILVGKDSPRMLPGFFNRNVKSNVKRYVSPDLFSGESHKYLKWYQKLKYNLKLIPEYIRSIFYIRKRIKESGADVVINFYELLVGMAYAVFPPQVHYFCVGHQYMFLHPRFEFPKNRSGVKLVMLRFLARISSINCSKRLALSFQPMEDAPQERLVVLPPLLRSEVFSLQPEQGSFIQGYMLDSHLMQHVMDNDLFDKEMKLHFFGEKVNHEYEVPATENLKFHQMDDLKFLDYLASCKAYTSTAGFDSICEAMLLGKPVMMLPEHIGQECNAYYAQKAGAGIISEKFDLDKLIDFVDKYEPNKGFVEWVKNCEKMILERLLRNNNINDQKVDYSPYSNVLNYETK